MTCSRLFMTAFVVMITFAPGMSAAQVERQSLKDLARRNGGKAALVLDADMPQPTLQSMCDGAQQIVQGRVTKTEPRLSKDEASIATYVTVAPSRSLKGG